MPRRNKIEKNQPPQNATVKRARLQRRPRAKGAYKPEAVEAVTKLVLRRKAVGASQMMIAAQVGVSLDTIYKMEKTKRAWPRQIRAVSSALRLLETRARQAETAFDNESPTNE